MKLFRLRSKPLRTDYLLQEKKRTKGKNVKRNRNIRDLIWSQIKLKSVSEFIIIIINKLILGPEVCFILFLTLEQQFDTVLLFNVLESKTKRFSHVDLSLWVVQDLERWQITTHTVTEPVNCRCFINIIIIHEGLCTKTWTSCNEKRCIVPDMANSYRSSADPGQVQWYSK